MDKKELLNKVFDLLYKSNLVFTKEGFKKRLAEKMKESHFELAFKTSDALIKELVAKDYLNQDEKHLMKSAQLLKSDRNKQTNYLEYLIGEYSESFDINYIHDEYVENIKKNEAVPAEYLVHVENSYEVIKQYLVNKNFVKVNEATNQFEI